MHSQVKIPVTSAELGLCDDMVRVAVILSTYGNANSDLIFYPEHKARLRGLKWEQKAFLVFPCIKATFEASQDTSWKMDGNGVKAERVSRGACLCIRPPLTLLGSSQRGRRQEYSSF